MSDKVKIALLSAVTAFAVAFGTGGTIAATQPNPPKSNYDQDRALILKTLSDQSAILQRLDNRARRIEIQVAELRVQVRKKK